MRRLVATAVAALSVLAAAPAHGQSWSSPDQASNVDGTQYDPEPRPCGSSSDVDASHRTDLDVTRLSVRHGRRDVVVTVRFADLVDGRRGTVEIPMLTPRRD